MSVIIRKPYGERQKRTEYPEKRSQWDEICEAIDVALARNPKDFRELIGILQEAGYEYKDGKQPALRGKGHAGFARFRSLGKGYSIEELCEVIAGTGMRFTKANLQRKPAQAHSLRRCIRGRSCRSLLMSVQKCRRAKAQDMRAGRKFFI